MRAKNSKRLVIDTDVLQSSGDENATDPRAINCRDFLKAVLSLSYRVVITPKISAELKNNPSHGSKTTLRLKHIVNFQLFQRNKSLFPLELLERFPSKSVEIGTE